MRLEGTLDAFSLPDIFQLLSFTKKTGTLHLRRQDGHGVVHLREGSVTGARSDVRRQALGRRIVGTGLVEDAALTAAVTRVKKEKCGLAGALAAAGAVEESVLRGLAAEQATDAIFDLLRWTEGDFAFVVDEADPDDLGAAMGVEDVVNEARRRIESWELSPVPPMDAVVSVTSAPLDEPTLSRDEWSLLALVDGRRTVADFVMLSGRGEYAVVCVLAGLVERGLLAYGDTTQALLRRQEQLQALEGLAEAPPARPAQPERTPARTAPVERAAVIPERPEPFTAPRQPEHAETAPAYARASAAPRPITATGPAQVHASVGDVQGSVAMQPAPELVPAPALYIERDPSVNKSLLLRLIAGVRGL